MTYLELVKKYNNERHKYKDMVAAGFSKDQLDKQKKIVYDLCIEIKERDKLTYIGNSNSSIGNYHQ